MAEEAIKDAEIADLSKQEESNDNQLDDLSDQAYDYTRLGLYTSEIYKIEIQNIPRHLTHAALKKFLKKLNLKVKKAKVIQNKRGKNFAFATFEDEEERLKAIDLLNNFVLKKNKLKAFKALPSKNPAALQSRNDDVEKINYDELSEEQLQQLLFKQICPLYDQNYDCQLQEKQESHRELLNEILLDIKELYANNGKASDGKSNADSTEDTNAQPDESSSAFLDMQADLSEVFEEIKAVKDQCTKYRNKCEFSVGDDGTIGFRLGSFKNSVKVVKPLNCILLNDKTNKVIDLFEKYTKEQTDLKPFNLTNRQGNIKQLTVRTSQSGCMVILYLSTLNVDDEKLNSEIEKLKALVQSGADLVTSCYIEIQNDRQLDSSKIKHQNGLIHIYGDFNLIQKMRNGEVQFALSPSAFFQVNVPAAELMYETVAQMLNLNENVILLDICSGIGSIGIYLANRVRHVIGVELNKDAVNDALHNAQLNNLDNISFVQGMAEEKMAMILREARKIDSNCEIIAILDPPRSGLKNSIISLIRNCSDIFKLAYVCCEAKFSRQNLIDLCRPCSNQYAGYPFHLAHSVSIDMFPYTSKCELVNIFKRDVSTKRGKAADKKVDVEECSSEKVGEKKVKIERNIEDEHSETDSNVDSQKTLQTASSQN